MRTVGAILTLLKLAFAATLGFAAFEAVAEPPSGLIATKQAKALAYEALTAKQKQAPGLDFEVAPLRGDARYLLVSVTWQGLPNGSVIVDNLAVDTKTGDVWSATSSCSEKTNAGLRALQRKLRHEFGISSSEYARIRAHGPLCDN